MTRSSPPLGHGRPLPVAAVATSLGALACAVALTAAINVGCGGAGDGASLDGVRLLTISECLDESGSPLFYPGDGRSIENSCPSGLRFVGEFDEPFFGSDGGICCSGAEPGDDDGAVAD